MNSLAVVPEVGTTLPGRVVGPITLTDVVRFAGALGDFNPLHHDVVAARAAGFEAPIAMGQMTAGLIAAWLADWCGAEHLCHLEVRWVSPVSVGDTVTFTGAVVEIDAAGDDAVAHVEFRATCGGTVVAHGGSSVVVGAAV